MGKGSMPKIKRVIYRAIENKEPVYRQILKDLVDKYYYPLIENISINGGLDIVKVDITDYYTLTLKTKISEDRTNATVPLNKVVEYVEQECSKVANNSFVSIKDSTTDNITFCIRLEIQE